MCLGSVDRNRVLSPLFTSVSGLRLEGWGLIINDSESLDICDECFERNHSLVATINMCFHCVTWFRLVEDGVVQLQKTVEDVEGMEEETIRLADVLI